MSFSQKKTTCGLKKNIKKLDNLKIDYFHIDIMDGIFVENITWEYKEIEKILKHRTTKKDIHLMVKDVKKYVEEYINLNPSIITFHYEATDNHVELINYIKQHNIKAGISIKPNTEVSEIKELLNIVDLVLVMSVEPGKGGQKDIDNSTNKINELNEPKDIILYDTERSPYQVPIYIKLANSEAKTTVNIPDTAMARLLMAPSTSPISSAFAVPIA